MHFQKKTHLQKMAFAQFSRYELPQYFILFHFILRGNSVFPILEGKSKVKEEPSDVDQY